MITRALQKISENVLPGRMSSLKSSHLDVRVGGGNLSMGVNWCKSVGVICSEGVKWCKSWDAMGGLFRIYPPWLKLPCKSGLQWAAMGGLFRNYPPWLKLPCKSGLQWAAMGGLFRIYPPWLNVQYFLQCFMIWFFLREIWSFKLWDDSEVERYGWFYYINFQTYNIFYSVLWFGSFWEKSEVSNYEMIQLV